MRTALTKHLDEVEQSMGLIVEEISRNKCSANYCENGNCYEKYYLEIPQSEVIVTDVMSFVSPKHSLRINCYCREGYAGNASTN